MYVHTIERFLLYYSCSNVDFGSILTNVYRKRHSENWMNFFTLLDITDYLVAPCLTTDEVAYIKVLIQEHHLCFHSFIQIQV